MISALADLKQEWRFFRDDSPGERFTNHRERMMRKSRTHALVAFALGVLLLAFGVVLLFMPGPGLLLIVFGLALVATHWKRLAHLLDRGEPRVRSAGRRLATWWRHAARTTKAALIGGGLLVSSAFLLATWRWVVSAYLL